MVRGVVLGEANSASNKQQLGPLLTISWDAKLGLTEHRIEEHLGRGKGLTKRKVVKMPSRFSRSLSSRLLEED